MLPTEKIVGNFIKFIIQPVVELIFAAAFLLFIWGLIGFLNKLNQGGDTSEGKQHMIWGIAGMVIMVSVLGIIQILSNTFGLGVNAKAGTVNVSPTTFNAPNITGQPR